MKNILLCVTGGIAAYKSVELARMLTEKNHVVRVVLTDSAKQFVTPLTFQVITHHPVYSDLFDASHDSALRHIELARWADIILIAPASANTIAKLAYGIADNLLTNVCLASTAPLLLAPAMNKNMWIHPATQKNIATLRERGAIIIGPDKGMQACGDDGFGRMCEPEKIISVLQKPKLLLKIIITAGPTQEFIDPIRYVTNKSSGKMGYALAAALTQRGATVTLISGPTKLEKPTVSQFFSVTSTAEMYDAVMNNIENTDIFISAAAPANYSAEIISTEKIKSHAEKMNIAFKKNPDIISAVAKLKKNIFIVGFSAETNNVIENAKQKLKNKNCDVMIANDVSHNQGMGAEDNAVTIINKTGDITTLPILPKSLLAEKIVDVVFSVTCKELI